MTVFLLRKMRLYPQIYVTGIFLCEGIAVIDILVSFPFDCASQLIDEFSNGHLSHIRILDVSGTK